MKYISTNKAAENWGVTPRWVRKWCKDQKIAGAIQIGNSWQIPEHAQKPMDMRTKESKVKTDNQNRMYLLMNADYCLHAPIDKINDYDRQYNAIQQLCLTGYLEEAYEKLDKFIKYCPESYRAPAYLSQATTCYYLGKRKEMESIYHKLDSISKEGSNSLTSLYLDIISGANNENVAYEDIPSEVLPAFLYRMQYQRIMNYFRNKTPVDNISLELTGKLIEEMNNEEVCAYYQSLLAQYYNFIGNRKLHDYHANQALDIILKRKWYFMIVEHSYNVNWNLDGIDENIKNRVTEMIQSLSETILGSYYHQLTIREEIDKVLLIKICSQLAYRKTNDEIAKNCQVSLYTVKKYVNEIYEITGRNNRDELGQAIMNQIAKI